MRGACPLDQCLCVHLSRGANRKKSSVFELLAQLGRKLFAVAWLRGVASRSLQPGGASAPATMLLGSGGAGVTVCVVRSDGVSVVSRPAGSACLCC